MLLPQNEEEPLSRSQSSIRNRLLANLPPDDYAGLAERLAPVTLELQVVLIEAHEPILYVYFPESGIVSTVADTAEGRIEIGITGREGLVGLPVVLGADRTPHSCFVQGIGNALRIETQDLREAIRERPSIFRPLGLYAQALAVQVGQTIYANAAFNIEARLARWILMTHDRTETEELLLTHEFLSIMLGVRRPGVTSAMHMLEGSGSIQAKRGRIRVLDREKLLRLTGDSYGVAENEYERLMAQAGPFCV